MSTATFLKTDTTTQGTWYNGATTVYGADGYNVIGYTGSGNPNYPSYATVSDSGTTEYTWNSSTSNVAALEYPPPGTSSGSDSKRIAAAWYNNSTFSIDIQDGNLHQIALYFFQDDSENRTQQVQITDDNNNNVVLDTRTVNVTSSGVWLVWTVSGKVTFTITLQSGNSAVVSGLFFDPAPATPAVFPPIASRPRFEPAYYE